MFQVTPKYYPTIVSLIEIPLGVVCMYVSLPGLIQTTNEFQQIQLEHQTTIAAAGFIFAVFGIIVSSLAIAGGLSFMLRRNRVLALWGSYSASAWYILWLALPLSINIVSYGSPYASNTFPSNSALTLSRSTRMPSISSSILRREPSNAFLTCETSLIS